MNKNNITIRKINTNDLNEISHIMQKLHSIHQNERPDIYIDLNKPFDIESLIPFEKETSPSFLAVKNDDIVGVCLAIYKIPQNPLCLKRKIAYIEAIYVKEEYRRMGIGKMLYEAVAEASKENNAESIELQISGFNKTAQKFYENIGMNTKSYVMEIKI